MLSGLYNGVGKSDIADISLPPRPVLSLPLERQTNSTVVLLSKLLGDVHSELLATPWYSQLLAYAMDHLPFSAVIDGSGTFSPVFDPNYFFLVVNPYGTREELNRLGVMTIHDLVHLSLGDIAPFTTAELATAREHLFEGKLQWKPDRTAEEESQVRDTYVRRLLEFECEAFLVSHVLLPYTLGGEKTVALLEDRELADVIESGEVSLMELQGIVQSIYDQRGAIGVPENASPSLRAVVKRVENRFEVDRDLSTFRYEGYAASGILPWYYLFLERIQPVDGPGDHRVEIANRIEKAEPLPTDILYYINAYLDSHYRNGPMLKEMAEGSERFNAPTLLRAYERDKAIRDLVATRRFSRPDDETMLIDRLIDYEFTIPSRVPSFETRRFPYLGRVLSTAGQIIRTTEMHELPQDIHYEYSRFIARDVRLEKGDRPFPHSKEERQEVFTELSKWREAKKAVQNLPGGLPDEEVAALGTLAESIVARPPALPHLPELLVYGYEQLGLLEAIETEEVRNWSLLDAEERVSLLRKIGEQYLKDFMFRLRWRSDSGEADRSFLTMFPLLTLPFGNRDDGDGESILARESKSAINYWVETKVRPALGAEDEISSGITSLLERFAPSLAIDIFRAYFVYGEDPEDYFAHCQEAGQAFTTCPPLTSEESQKLRGLIDARYDTFRFGTGALSIMADRTMYGAIGMMNQSFGSFVLLDDFSYHSTYNSAFYEIGSGALRQVRSTFMLASGAIALSLGKIPEWTTHVGGSSVLQVGEYMLDHAEQTLEHLEALSCYAAEIAEVMYASDGSLPYRVGAYRKLMGLNTSIADLCPYISRSVHDFILTVSPLFDTSVFRESAAQDPTPEEIAKLELLSERIDSKFHMELPLYRGAKSEGPFPWER